MHWNKSIVGCAFTLALAIGCGQTAPATSAQGKDEACADTCKQAEGCSADVDYESCVKRCVQDDSLSRAGQEAVAKCQEKQACEQANAVPALACILSEVKDVPASEAGKTFCDAGLKRATACRAELAPAGSGDVAAPDPDQCSDLIALAADEFLTDLNECLDGSGSCQAVQGCLLIEIAARADLASIQNPKPGDPGLIGLLSGLFGTSLEIPGFDTSPDDAPDGTGGPAPGADPETDAGTGTETDPGTAPGAGAEL